METGIKLLSVITESDQFSLTEEDVRLASEEATNEVRKWRIMLNDPDKQLEKIAENSLVHAEREAQALSASPAEVLTETRTFFNRANQLTHLVSNKEQLLSSLGNEFPDIHRLYGLLRRQPWGYRLGQALITRQQFRKK